MRGESHNTRFVRGKLKRHAARAHGGARARSCAANFPHAYDAVIAARSDRAATHGAKAAQNLARRDQQEGPELQRVRAGAEQRNASVARRRGHAAAARAGTSRKEAACRDTRYAAGREVAARSGPDCECVRARLEDKVRLRRHRCRRLGARTRAARRGARASAGACRCAELQAEQREAAVRIANEQQLSLLVLLLLLLLLLLWLLLRKRRGRRCCQLEARDLCCSRPHSHGTGRRDGADTRNSAEFGRRKAQPRTTISTLVVQRKRRVPHADAAVRATNA